MKCARCQQDNPSHALFCLKCGASLQPVEGGAHPAPSYADVQRSLTEALKQQAATSNILQVISSSPSDVRPVFDAIIQNAIRLCEAFNATVFRFDGSLIHVAAHHNIGPEAADVVNRVFPTSPDKGTVTGRAILARAVTHVRDVATDPAHTHPELLEAGFRAVLSVPMLRNGSPIGAIMVTRREPRAFSDDQIDLLKTFAAQAVIGIENVRRFNETKEALEQQTATAEILRVISSSPTDVQPVFEAIVENAVRLCRGNFGAVWRYDGRLQHLVAHHNIAGEALDYLRQRSPRSPDRPIREHRVVQIADFETDPDISEEYRAGARLRGSRANVQVPMLRDGDCLGVIIVGKSEPGYFPETQVGLLKTFADQAVIAIENVRLFKELEARNSDLSESLEQQTATSEILRIISQSPTDVQPVFDTIVRSVVRLCDGLFAGVSMFDGEMILSPAALHNYTPEALAAVHRIFPSRPNRSQMIGRAILSRAPEHLPDVFEDPEYNPAVARAGGWRSALAVPMLRDGQPLGAILIARAQPGPFSARQVELLQTFADQAVIAIENVRLFKELEARNRDLTDALDRQTSTADILRVISRSPTDIQQVFDTIVRSASRLCSGHWAAAMRFDGELIHLVAQHNIRPAAAELEELFPCPPSQRLPVGRAILERKLVHIPDATEDPDLAPGVVRRARSFLVVPMLRESAPIGAIAVSRPTPGPFPPSHIELLTSFADQAVIAIENVRLFKELEDKNRALTAAHAQVTEALEQKTATSEILRVISNSPTDTQPVFDTIADSAAELTDALFAGVFLVQDNQIRVASIRPLSAPGRENFMGLFPRPVDRDSITGCAILDRRVLHIGDVDTDASIPQAGREGARRLGAKSVLCVPMLREGTAIGVITVSRIEPRPFTIQQITLLQTFADQAVIAIENVRLFKELEARNKQLTETLEQQTATSEILRVISSSPTDLQPVFDMVVRNAGTLCGAAFGGLHRLDNGRITLDAHYGVPDDELMILQRDVFPLVISRESAAGRAILDREVVQIRDIREDPGFRTPRLKTMQNYRTLLAVPMMREGIPLGALALWRREVQPFSETEIGLVRTFADQAVIAIENVRLFHELEARTRDLTRSVQQLTALGEVGRAVSSTLDLETVLTTIVSRAVQLSGLDGGVVFEYDEGAEEFVLRVATETGGALAEARRTTRIRKGEGVLGRTAITLEPVQVPDIAAPGAYEGRLRENLIESGIRAILAVPMVREGRLIGCLGVTRNRTGEFPAETIELLRTFATQSALAIQNARLFRELEDKSRQLEAASQHKSEFLANMSHELRTPLNAIIGFSEVLGERMFGELNEKQEEYLRDIHASGQHLLSLINDILDLSKIEAGRMELELTEFNLPAALDNALTLVRERAGRRGIVLQMTVDDRLDQVRADERKVRQVVLNLLSNAIKFTPEGGRIELRAVPKDGAVEVSVSDTGVGIAPEDQEAIFEEFKQVGTSDKKVEGTGLGLALSRKFIELHGGRIWVKSQVGQGSTFTFTMPVRRGE